MTWQLLGIDLLVRAAIGGFVLLAAASVAVRLCRQPADRIRLIELALVGAFLIPWLAMIPGLPRWSLGLMQSDPDQASAAPQPTPWATVSASAEVEQLHSQPVGPLPETTVEAPGSRQAISIASDMPTPAAPNSPIEMPAPLRSESSLSIAGWILVAYGVVTAGMLAWSVLGLWRLFILWRNARPASPELIHLFREVVGPGADRVRLLVSDRVDAPVTFAGLHSFIVLPAAADVQELKFGLAHEWSHIERGDVWRWYLVTFGQVVLFYQPMFWWLRRQLRLSQDYLADARAAEQTLDSTDYAEYLVALGRQRLSRPSRPNRPALALGISDRLPHLTRRVHPAVESAKYFLKMTLLEHFKLSWAQLAVLGAAENIPEITLRRARELVPLIKVCQGRNVFWMLERLMMHDLLSKVPRV